MLMSYPCTRFVLILRPKCVWIEHRTSSQLPLYDFSASAVILSGPMMPVSSVGGEVSYFWFLISVTTNTATTSYTLEFFFITSSYWANGMLFLERMCAFVRLYVAYDWLVGFPVVVDRFPTYSHMLALMLFTRLFASAYSACSLASSALVQLFLTTILFFLSWILPR